MFSVNRGIPSRLNPIGWSTFKIRMNFVKLVVWAVKFGREGNV